jgi:hypothetical protein
MSKAVRVGIVRAGGLHFVGSHPARRAGEFMVIAALDAEFRRGGAWCVVTVRPPPNVSLQLTGAGASGCALLGSRILGFRARGPRPELRFGVRRHASMNESSAIRAILWSSPSAFLAAVVALSGAGCVARGRIQALDAAARACPTAAPASWQAVAPDSAALGGRLVGTYDLVTVTTTRGREDGPRRARMRFALTVSAERTGVRGFGPDWPNRPLGPMGARARRDRGERAGRQLAQAH